MTIFLRKVKGQLTITGQFNIEFGKPTSTENGFKQHTHRTCDVFPCRFFFWTAWISGLSAHSSFCDAVMNDVGFDRRGCASCCALRRFRRCSHRCSYEIRSSNEIRAFCSRERNRNANETFGAKMRGEEEEEE